MNLRNSLYIYIYTYIMNLLNKYKQRILVIGDIILDHNIYCHITKNANEKALPVFEYDREEYKLGGCGNVVNNLYSLGCDKIYILSVIGNDNSGNIIVNYLNKFNNVENKLIISENVKTTVKKRYFSSNDLIFRIDDEEKFAYTDSLINIMMINIREIINTKNIDCVVFSDYAKGVLTPELCQDIIIICNKKEIITIVDPKQNFIQFKGCTLIKPNKLEASIFYKKHIDKLEDVHKYINNTLGCKYSLITLSDRGLSLFNGNKLFSSNIESKEVFDVTGAGDIVTAVVAVLLKSCRTDNDIELLSKYANYLATKSVQHIGVYTLQFIDIINARNYFNNNKQIFLNELQYIFSDNIVFTNGCFDLLHLGHIETLKYAKSKGDILVVGLNSDISVRRIKGDSRPIQNQETRLQILSNMYFIDYIILFDEDTPLNIIKQLKPNILVKGGDYNKDLVIGKEYVDKIIIAPFRDATSTTNTIHKILESKY